MESATTREEMSIILQRLSEDASFMDMMELSEHLRGLAYDAENIFD